MLAAMTALSALGCKTAVTGYLMCTDNMPSGKAMKLGDVLTVARRQDRRGHQHGRRRPARDDGRPRPRDRGAAAPDAIVDIATLTGACQRALGNDNAGVIGNDQPSWTR